MKKTASIIFALFLLITFKSQAQSDHQRDDIIVYENLLDELGFDKTVPIYNKTATNVFKKVNLKKNNLIWANKDSIK